MTTTTNDADAAALAWDQYVEWCEARGMDPEDPESRDWYDAAEADAREEWAERQGEYLMEARMGW